MSEPIKSAPPPPPRPQPIERPESQRSSHSTARRNDTERTQSSSSRQTADERINPDGQLFAQLLMPHGSQNDADSNTSGSGFTFPVQADVMAGQLVDELAQQLPVQGPSPFSVTLLMPNLGKVYVKANRTESHWSIDLGFERTQVFERLSARQGACERALTKALGHDVELSLRQES